MRTFGTCVGLALLAATLVGPGCSSSTGGVTLIDDGGAPEDGATDARSESGADVVADGTGGDGGGVGAQCGGFTTGNAACDTCLAAQCCSESRACAEVEGNECENLARCVAPCTDQACQQNCANQHPTGVSALLAVVDCAQKKCPTECPTP